MSNAIDELDPRVARFATPTACEQFAKNVEKRGKPELAVQARLRKFELLASAHGASTIAEREAFEAVHAYEWTLLQKHGRITRASRTWPMIKQKGVIATVESIVTRNQESMAFTALVKAGLHDKAFEAVVLRHPHLFSEEAIRRSKDRLDALQ
jgi:hypothetical protein